MSIVVTGGAGFIGANFLLDWFRHHDETIINIDKLSYARAPEFLADRFATWWADRSIALRCIQPGKPNQNALGGRFNRTFRTEVPDTSMFVSMDQGREITAEWMHAYNEEHPPDALAGETPRPNSGFKIPPGVSLDTVSLTGKLAVSPQPRRLNER